MKVQLLTGRAGYSCQNEPGDIIEVSEREGRALVTSGQAEYVKPSASTAVQPAGATRHEHKTKR